MENENKTKQDCGCGTDCCTPKKSNLWMKIIFFVIISAAITIVILKLASKNNSEDELKGTVVHTEKSGCGDSTKSKPCSDKNATCCPKAKK